MTSSGREADHAGVMIVGGRRCGSRGLHCAGPRGSAGSLAGARGAGFG